MKIIFFCIETDWLTRGQIVKACELINDNLGIPYTDMELVVKPYKNVSSTVVAGGSQIFIRRLLRILSLRVFYSAYIRYFLKKTKIKSLSNKQLKIHSIRSANSEDAVKILEETQNPLVFFVYFDEIIKEPILRLCKPLNVHPGFLPEYRGVSPVYWQILDGKSIAAISIHRMTPGIDEGDIVAEVPFNIVKKKDSFFTEMQNYKQNIIANSLYIAVRRLTKFDESFGITQSNYKGTPKYFPRPTQ
ncbi:MAG: formyltransferase family protein [Desulfuromonadaceae bacterium]